MRYFKLTIILLLVMLSSVRAMCTITVSMTSYTNSTFVYTSNTNIPMSASVTDTSGTISKVEFYQGGTLLGTCSSSPYNYLWSNVAANSYALTAKAYDANGSTTSSALDITVTTTHPSPLACNIASPANNATFVAPASIALTANVSSGMGSFSGVDYFSGGAQNWRQYTTIIIV